MPNGGWVLEVGIQAFFDTIDHGVLFRFLDERVTDGVIRRAIDKWLSAGVLEKGAVTHPDQGTPQGGVISPLLATLGLRHGVSAALPAFLLEQSGNLRRGDRAWTRPLPPAMAFDRTSP